MILPKVVDAHLHLREGQEARSLLPITAPYCEYILVMPNITNFVHDITTLLDYSAFLNPFLCGQKPLYALGLTRSTTRMILEGCGVLIAAVKGYPAAPGKQATFNSQHGIDFRRIEDYFDCFAYMEEVDIPFLGHFEMPTQPTFKREIACYKMIDSIIKKFPKLRIVFEHISCKETIKFVEDRPNVYGTVTPTHLVYTIDDIIGNDLNPYAFCKPVPKQEADREALINAVTTNHKRKFMYGSDSAYHPHERKLKGKPGVFCAPVAIPVLAQIFDEKAALHTLKSFTSTVARKFYRLDEPTENFELIEDMWMVGSEICGTRPLMAGQLMKWRIKSDQ